MSGPKPSAPTIDLICELCKKPFTRVKHTVKPGRGRFCSVACSNTAKVGVYSRPIVRKTVTCKCGKEFTVVPSTRNMDRGKFCSVPCAMKWRRSTVPTAKKKPAAPAPIQRTSITPKAADRQPPVDDDKGGAVLCARCRQPRPRGAFCQRCERRAFQQEAS